MSQVYRLANATLLVTALVFLSAREAFSAALPDNKDAKQGKELYVFQNEVEDRMKGEAEERKRYAALLPLRILVLRGEPAQENESMVHYLDSVLDFIEANKVREALPDLERAISPRNTAFHKLGRSYYAKGRLVKVWVTLKTDEMKPIDKAKYMAALLQPGLENSDSWYGVAELYRELDKVGKGPLMDVLLNTKQEMTQDGDGLLAVSVARMLLRPEFTPSAEEIETLAKSGNGYVKSVMCLFLAKLGDKQALELLDSVWRKYPTNHPSMIRFFLFGPEVAKLEGARSRVPLLMKELGEEAVTPSSSALQELMLAHIAKAGDTLKSDELRDYLRKLLGSKPHLGDKAALTDEDFRALGGQVRVRQAARGILDMWEAPAKPGPK